MKYLLLLATTVGVYGQSYGSFSATSYGIDGDDIRITTGTYTAPRPSVQDEIIANYRRMNEELSRDINHNFQMQELRRQTEELSKQTRILREMANE